MSDTFATQYLDAMKRALDAVKATGLNGEPFDLNLAFSKACDLAAGLKSSGGVLYIIGNGGSAMMASHMAVDFCKNAGVRSLAFNDPAFLTAIGNDTSYAQIFEMPLLALGKPGDALATVSSSGNSPNVVAAIKAARKIGMSVVTFSGMSPENQSRRAGDINFWVPSKTYGVAESIHAILLHCWLDQFMGVAEWNK
jgi:D-sedoheptulose 7-phosphate isomerase